MEIHHVKTSRKNFWYYVLPAAPATINKVAGAIFQVKRISETCRESGDTAKVKAKNLLAIIDEKYHIR
jgi:hypothetical protein